MDTYRNDKDGAAVGDEARAGGQNDRSIIDCKILYQAVLGNIAKVGIDMLRLYESMSLQLCNDDADEDQEAVAVEV